MRFTATGLDHKSFVANACGDNDFLRPSVIDDWNENFTVRIDYTNVRMRYTVWYIL